MNQPVTQPSPDSSPVGVKAAGLARTAALGGVAFLAFSAASDLVIGPNPAGDAPLAKVTSFYAAHHAQVLAGGMLLAWAAIFFALFGTAAWARIRQAPVHPLLAGASLAGTAVTTAALLAAATTYVTLGGIGASRTIAPAALQAWHIKGSELSLAGNGGVMIFLLAVAAAGIAARVLPRTLAWSALIIGLVQLTPAPVGFLASLLVLLWAAAAGIVMFARPAGAPSAPGHSARAHVHAGPAAAS
jgi:hypothetical protein